MGWELSMETCFLCIYNIHPVQCKRQGALGKMDWLSHFLCTELAMLIFSEPPHCTPVPRNLVIYNSTFLSSSKTRCFWKYQQFDSGSSIVSKVLNATLSTCRGLSSVFRCRNQIIVSNKLGLKQKVHYNSMCPFFIMWFHWTLSEFFECVFFTIWFYWILSEFVEFVSPSSLCDLADFLSEFIEFVYPFSLCDFTEFWVNSLNFMFPFSLCDFIGFWVNSLNLCPFILWFH